MWAWVLIPMPDFLDDLEFLDSQVQLCPEDSQTSAPRWLDQLEATAGRSPLLSVFLPAVLATSSLHPLMVKALLLSLLSLLSQALPREAQVWGWRETHTPLAQTYHPPRTDHLPQTPRDPDCKTQRGNFLASEILFIASPLSVCLNLHGHEFR